MKTRANTRLRPMRTIAFLGIAMMAAMPVSVAKAGTEDPMAVAQEGNASRAASTLSNGASVKLIPPATSSVAPGGVLHSGTAVVQAIPEVSDTADAEGFDLLGTGEASWYGPKFAGRPTASGETFDPTELTAAHRTLPFGSLVRVTSERTGKSVVVRINDRGPYHGNRVIDLSEAAAREIGIKNRGRGHVELALLDD